MLADVCERIAFAHSFGIFPGVVLDLRRNKNFVYGPSQPSNDAAHAARADLQVEGGVISKPL